MDWSLQPAHLVIDGFNDQLYTEHVSTKAWKLSHYLEGMIWEKAADQSSPTGVRGSHLLHFINSLMICIPVPILF